MVFSAERHLRRAEITVSVLGHPMVGLADGADEFTALYQAAEKLEKQVLKLRAKWRDTKRDPKPAWDETAPAEARAAGGSGRQGGFTAWKSPPEASP